MTEKTFPVSIRDLHFRYDGTPVLSNINLVVEENDFVGVLGPNGGGKTTLLKIILGLLNPSSGAVRVYGRTPVNARTMVGYVPQFVSFDTTFPVKVKDVVYMGRLGLRSSIFRYNSEDRHAVEEAMRNAEVLDLQDHVLGTLSGGQRQRVLIARALAKRPSLLLLDEPTTSVDHRVEQSIYELLRTLNKQMTIILVTHDVGVVSSYVNRVACINRDLVSHPVNEITSEDIKQLYRSDIQMIKHKCDI